MSHYNVVLLTIIALLISLVSSTPTPIPQTRNRLSRQRTLDHCTTHPEDYESISTYNLRWFQTHVLPSPSIDFTRTLFYTAGMSAEARAYACNQDYTTIWDVWPEALYNSSAAASNPFSCIHNNPAARRMFFKTMSQAYATLAEGTILVMHNPRHYENSPTNGIWALVERETIVNHADRVDAILKLKGNDVRSLLAVWIRGLGVGKWSVQRMLDLMPERPKDFKMPTAMRYEQQTRLWKGRLMGRGTVGDDSVIDERGDGVACKILDYEFVHEIDW